MTLQSWGWDICQALVSHTEDPHIDIRCWWLPVPPHGITGRADSHTIARCHEQGMVCLGGEALPNLSVDLKLWQVLHFVRKKEAKKLDRRQLTLELMPVAGSLEAPLWSSESNEKVSPTYNSSYGGCRIGLTAF